MEPRGQELVERYKRTYFIPDDAPITEEMILDHWELEKRLTQELLASTPENRWEVFEKCYTELYSQLEWINKYVETDPGMNSDFRFQNWLKVIGSPPQTIYEVGSGKAELTTYLARNGFLCKATEITRERGRKYAEELPNLIWDISDGVHLDQFEEPGTYDVVISASIVEHLHPDDELDHFKSARKILAEGGRYIFTAPHQCAGPQDVSAVFNYDEAIGMHLHEFTYGELKSLCTEAGFSKICAVLAVPPRLENPLTRALKPITSHSYLNYLCTFENLLLRFRPSPLRRKLTKLSRALLFVPNIFMVAYKD